jgi:hypothetical protein
MQTGGASKLTRGEATHIRQQDDNSGKTLLTPQERRTVNAAIHDKSLDHKPKQHEAVMKIVNEKNK